MTFQEAAIAVTYRCNSKCIMCSIWKSPSTEELEPSKYGKIPSSLKTINITGGEPFLRSDLLEVIAVIHDRVPGSRLVFSSNGLLTDRIVDTMVKIRSIHPRVGVGISIDGLEPTHDRIRGVPGMFKHAIATVKTLKVKGFTDLRIAMTVTTENQSEIIDVFELSRDLGVEFTITMAHGSDIYFGELDDTLNADRSELLKETSELIRRQLRSSIRRIGLEPTTLRVWSMRGSRNISRPDARRENDISSCLLKATSTPATHSISWWATYPPSHRLSMNCSHRPSSCELEMWCVLAEKVVG